MKRMLTDEVVARLSLHEGRAQLLDEIMSTPGREPAEPETTRVSRAGVRWLVPLAAAAMVAAAVALPFAWPDDGADPGRPGTPVASQPGATDEASTQTTPDPASRHRVVLTRPGGWRVEHVREEAESGALSYSRDDGESLEITWRSAETYDFYVADRADQGRPQEVSLLGEAAQLWEYAATDHTVIGPPVDGWFVEVRGTGVTLPELEVLLEQLRRVDGRGFRTVVAKTAVQRAELGATVEEMLADVSVPPGLDPGTIAMAGEFNQRYDVGAKVTQAVTCGWLEVYAAGQEAEDEALVEDAVSAMAQSREWAILQEMADEGDWPGGIWQTADEMAAGDPAIGVAERSVCVQE